MEPKLIKQFIPKTKKDNGCSVNKKCPCPTYLNCNVYVDKEKQEKRISQKSSFADAEIKIWYKTNFKLEIEMVDIVTTG